MRAGVASRCGLFGLSNTVHVYERWIKEKETKFGIAAVCMDLKNVDDL